MQAMLEQNPLLPMMNLSPLSTADLGDWLPIIILGMVVIAVGIYIVKKLQIFGGALITKEDQQFFDKAKRALGMGRRSNVPTHHVSAD